MCIECIALYACNDVYTVCTYIKSPIIIIKVQLNMKQTLVCSRVSTPSELHLMLFGWFDPLFLLPPPLLLLFLTSQLFLSVHHLILFACIKITVHCVIFRFLRLFCDIQMRKKLLCILS